MGKVSRAQGQIPFAQHGGTAHKYCTTHQSGSTPTEFLELTLILSDLYCVDVTSILGGMERSAWVTMKSALCCWGTLSVMAHELAVISACSMRSQKFSRQQAASHRGIYIPRSALQAHMYNATESSRIISEIQCRIHVVCEECTVYIWCVMDRRWRYGGELQEKGRLALLLSGRF